MEPPVVEIQSVLETLSFVDVRPEVLALYSRSTLPWTLRPSAIAYPENEEQVVALVQLANKHRIPLYPISGGRNWGYGSAMAPGEGYVIVDLSRMNRIVEVNEELAYVVVEPGVTQGDLQKYLEHNHPNLWMDANGAGHQGTLVGNVLDRGFGHTVLGERCRQVCGMEVVLGNGELVKTGFGHYPHSQTTYVYPHGVGPSLTGLFSQSNYGIVTRMGMWLMPKPESYRAFFFSVSDTELPGLVEKLGRLKRSGVLRSTVHVANALRALTNMVEYPWEETAGRKPVSQKTIDGWCERYRLGAWSGSGAVYGPKSLVKASLQSIRKELHPIKINVVGGGKLSALRFLVKRLPQHWAVAKRFANLLSVLEPALGLLCGKQTDFYLRTSAWRSPSITSSETCPFTNGSGLIWVVPALANTAKDVKRVREILTEIYHRHGFDAPITLTFVNDRSLIATTNINFNPKSDQDVAAAKECYGELLRTLIQQGYPPYRMGVGGFEFLDEGSTFWNTARAIKKALDPQGIISPGRYFGEKFRE